MKITEYLTTPPPLSLLFKREQTLKEFSFTLSFIGEKILTNLPVGRILFGALA